MKKSTLAKALVCAVSLSLVTSSCIGSFSLSDKLLTWNKSVGNKYENALVFFAFLVVPVYPVAMMADLLVLNSIEFWSGNAPLDSKSTVVEGENGRYMVQQDPAGYTVTNLEDQASVRFNYTEENSAWSVVDDNGVEHVLVSSENTVINN